MSLRINDVAPNFTAQTTNGPIDFHDWIGDSWAILFSHPKDFTPVCTTELGYMAKIEPEFTRRHAKLIGLSVDPVDSHSRWLNDIEETQGAKVNYRSSPTATSRSRSSYNMLPAEEPGTSEGRTAATNQTVRSVFVIGPDKKIKLMLTYPMTTGRNFDEILRVLRFDAAHRKTQGRDARQLEARRRRHHCGLGLRRRRQDAVPRRLEVAQALSAHRQAAGLGAKAEARGAGRGP
jgi:alkyl hydroperoxide reductase subunit AhpC